MFGQRIYVYGNNRSILFCSLKIRVMANAFNLNVAMTKLLLNATLGFNRLIY